MSELTSQYIDERLEENKKLLIKMDGIISSLSRQKAEGDADLEADSLDDRTFDRIKLIDRDLEKYREKRRQVEKDITEIRQKYKLIQLATERSMVDAIQSRVLKISQERELIRSEIVPALEGFLNEIEARKKELETLILGLSNELSLQSRRQTSQEDDSEIRQ